MTPKTVVRGGWGISYVHVNRIGSPPTCCRSTARR